MLPQSPEQDAIRLHVEHGEDGLHVWIGADGAGAAVSVRAASIIAELRRSDPIQAMPLASLVFNGRILYANGSRPTPSETPR